MSGADIQTTTLRSPDVTDTQRDGVIRAVHLRFARGQLSRSDAVTILMALGLIAYDIPDNRGADGKLKSVRYRQKREETP